MPKKKISIIMNCYNAEKFLKDALQSILLQNYENWELIFYDNQSNDKSYQIYKSFKDKRFKYYKSKKFEKYFISGVDLNNSFFVVIENNLIH